MQVRGLMHRGYLCCLWLGNNPLAELLGRLGLLIYRRSPVSPADSTHRSRPKRRRWAINTLTNHTFVTRQVWDYWYILPLFITIIALYEPRFCYFGVTVAKYGRVQNDVKLEFHEYKIALFQDGKINPFKQEIRTTNQVNVPICLQHRSRAFCKDCGKKNFKHSFTEYCWQIVNEQNIEWDGFVVRLI